MTAIRATPLLGETPAELSASPPCERCAAAGHTPIPHSTALLRVTWAVSAAALGIADPHARVTLVVTADLALDQHGASPFQADPRRGDRLRADRHSAAPLAVERRHGGRTEAAGGSLESPGLHSERDGSGGAGAWARPGVDELEPRKHGDCARRGVAMLTARLEFPDRQLELLDQRRAAVRACQSGGDLHVELRDAEAAAGSRAAVVPLLDAIFRGGRAIYLRSSLPGTAGLTGATYDVPSGVLDLGPIE
ncbi:MAG TPA: hypothetical protein PKC43_09405 [Phycisphaerales bacterium]|mgnify:CR=1 FL=1|nr:hypothetical protein [Phycisphaerales bacterium]HMP37650.1 hypothetical protein [Phycisphaerales bacterium]